MRNIIDDDLGIRVSTTPSVVNMGVFSLPLEFDTNQFASHWAEEKSVPYLEQRQPIVGTQLDSPGWSVWKQNADSPPHRVVDARGTTYVLMFRSRALQDRVNAIYGNKGLEVKYKEQLGLTHEGATIQDQGILGEERLAAIEPSSDAINPPQYNEVEGIVGTTATSMQSTSERRRKH